MNLSNLKNHRRRSRWAEGILSKNPVFVLGLALPFAVMITDTLKQAAAISVLFAISLIPSVLLAYLIGKRLPEWVMLITSSLFSMAIIMSCVAISSPVSTLQVVGQAAAVPPPEAANVLFPLIDQAMVDPLGIYSSILSVNTVLCFLCRRHARQKQRPILALADGFSYSLGFALALCLIAAVRELLGVNQLWGFHIPFPIRLAGMQMAFSGFIVTALFCALFRAVKRAVGGSYYRRNNRRPEKEVSMP